MISDEQEQALEDVMENSGVRASLLSGAGCVLVGLLLMFLTDTGSRVTDTVLLIGALFLGRAEGLRTIHRRVRDALGW